MKSEKNCAGKQKWRGCRRIKKKNGYKRSTELSKEYGMYRQDYCGCVFSMREREEQKARIEQEILQNNGI